MTRAQIDLAHKTVSDLGHCAKAAEQYVNASMAAVMRNAASLLQQMIDEYEADEQPLGEPGPTVMGGVDRAPSTVWKEPTDG